MNKLNEFIGKLLVEMAIADCYVNGVPAISQDTLMETIKNFDQEDNHGWISVEDSTPDDYKDVLCWCEDSANEVYLIGFYDKMTKYWSLDYDGDRDYEVVAWQPLPEEYERKYD